MTATVPPLWTVYLLHFDGEEQEVPHYVGITTPPRLMPRMREHAAGRGSKATAAACVLGLTWHLARTWPTRERVLEQRLQGHPGLSALCPVCQGREPLATYRPTKNAATREWPRYAETLREALELGGGVRSSSREKREGQKALPLFPSSGQQ